MSRQARVIAEGYPHHIVHRGHNRQRIFRDDHDKVIFLMMLNKNLELTGCRLMAYCLMPNHIHLMIIPRKRDDLVSLMRRLATMYAMYFNESSGRKGALWENRYFSSFITEEEYMWRTAKYICLNPVRAGLVDDPCDYIWSSARELLRGTRGRIPLAGWMNELQRGDFSDIVLDEAETTIIGYMINKNLPYQSDKIPEPIFL